MRIEGFYAKLHKAARLLPAVLIYGWLAILARQAGPEVYTGVYYSVYVLCGLLAVVCAGKVREEEITAFGRKSRIVIVALSCLFSLAAFRPLRGVGGKPRLDTALMLLGAVGFSLLRTNGWYALLALFAVASLKGWTERVLFLPVLVVLAGLWLGTPVFAEFRYACPIILTVPFFLEICICHSETP